MNGFGHKFESNNNNLVMNLGWEIGGGNEVDVWPGQNELLGGANLNEV
jgi:hypothetical protein